MPRLPSTVHDADRDLVKGLNEGDESAFAALYEEYGERLYDYALTMSGDAKVAADIVHDTFIDAGRRAPRMRDHLHLSSWLYGSARRRCIRRGRAKALFWDLDAEFSDAPFLDRAEPDGDAPGRPPSEEAHALLGAALAELEPVEQEVMLLAFRHGLRPVRLGAVLGLSPRRAATRVREGRARFESALRAEVRRVDRVCAAASASDERRVAAAVAARPPDRPDEANAPPRRTTTSAPRPLRRALCAIRRRPEAPPADPATERHITGCSACAARGRVSAAALLRRAPAPVLPAALRHRVMHTATDPELAGHRADIAARGGGLTPAGLPSQPDVPSPFTRRWLVSVGGMAGALVAALIAAFIIGPGIDGDSLSWPPFRTQPQPSITGESPSGGSEPDAQAAVPEHGAAPPHGSPGQPPLSPQAEQPTPPESADDPTRSPQPTTVPPERPGDLVVDPGRVELYGTKSATVSLAASSGPVTWTAMTSTSQLELSETQGGMPADGTAQVTVQLKTFIVGLPGEGTLTFTDSEGAPHTVTVVWGISLL